MNFIRASRDEVLHTVLYLTHRKILTRRTTVLYPGVYQCYTRGKHRTDCVALEVIPTGLVAIARNS
jgi:hypothetical protein